MAEKVVKTRIQQKHDIEANWNKATNFIPLAGEMIVYDVDSNYSYERFKIGDGTSTVTALPFADSNHKHSKLEITDFPVIPSSVSAIEHQYAVSNSKDNVSNVTTWNSISSPLTQRQRACVYGNGFYVVCGTNGEMVYSLNCTAWTSVTKFTDGVITGITYGKGIFVAIDSNGVIWIAKETPLAWESVAVTWKLIASGTTAILEGICYANNRFVLVGEPNLVAFSDDGRTWTETSVQYNFKAVTFGNGKYVGVGNSGAVAVSYDGENWTDYSDPAITGSYRAATFGGGKYVIGCQGGTIRYSDDGRTWTTATTNSTSSVNYIRGIVYAEGKFYAVMYISTGKGEIWVSNDAATWTVQKVADGRLWCCAYGNGIIFASGDAGAVYTLNLGIEWKASQPALTNGQYLWERTVLTLSDGGEIVSDGVCVDSYLTPDAIGAELAGAAAAVQSSLGSHTGNKSNPHGVTAAQVGADPAGSASGVQTNLNSHTADKKNPHDVTAAQVGADPKGSADAVQSNLTTHINKKDNPHGVTLSQLGLTADATELNYVDGVTSNIQTQLNSKSNTGHDHDSKYDAKGAADAVQSNLSAHANKKDNPHGVTLSQLGLTATATELNYVDGVTSSIQTQLNGKSSTSHDHNSAYDVKGAAAAVQSSLGSHTGNKSNPHGVTYEQAGADKAGSAASALASAKEYADSAVTKVKNDLLNGAGGAYDTLKELGDLIDDNKDAIDALEIVAAGKADKTHPHAISDVTGLQTALDGKAASSHGTHVSYSTTKPVMDGTASVGSASTVARSDHKHPTDTSRAAKTDFDSHTSNKSNPHGVTASQVGADPAGSASGVQTNLNSHTANKSNPHGVTCSQISAVPTSRTVNGKALSGNITLSASDVGAAVSSHGHTYISDGTVGVKGSDSNEISFASNSAYIYFGYDNRLGSTGKVDTYKFGRHAGPSSASDGNIECGSLVAGRTLKGGTVTVGDKVTLQYDSTNECINFVF